MNKILGAGLMLVVLLATPGLAGPQTAQQNLIFIEFAILQLLDFVGVPDGI